MAVVAVLVLPAAVVTFLPLSVTSSGALRGPLSVTNDRNPTHP
jgi:hypothetical protein